MKARFFSFIIALIALFAFNDASAQNPHLQGPLYAIDHGDYLEICYDFAGLGNVSEIPMQVSYTPTIHTECENPQGHVAPGQSRTLPRTSQTVPIEVSNGRARGCKTLDKDTYSAGPGPNPKWTCKVVDVSYSNITVKVRNRTFEVTDIRYPSN